MNSKLPATIFYPNKFKQSKPAGFDGVFDWSWTEGCFGETKIKPMDIDGAVERKGNFLIFETKDPGRPIPKGQQFTLKTLYKGGNCTLILIWAEDGVPGNFLVHYPPDVGGQIKAYEGVEKAREVVSRWFEYANKNPK